MIYLLTGNIETGKSTALYNWTKDRNDVFGVLTPINQNNTRSILDVNTKECFEMETHSKTADVILVGRYRFLKTAFKIGNEIIKKAVKNIKSGYVIIDELGKLELESKGFHKSASFAISETRNDRDLHLILIIRSSLLLKMIEKYSITDYQLLIMGELNQFQELTQNEESTLNFIEEK